MINKAVLKIDSLKYKETIETLLNETFPSLVLNWNGTILSFSCDDEEAFELKLNKHLLFYTSELGINISCLIVPYFDEIFLKYLDLFKNEIYTVFEFYVKNTNLEMVINDCQQILMNFNNDDYLTIKAFLSSNANLSLTAEELFMHRNSLTYRLNKFSKNTQIEFRDLNSLMFLKFIFSICA